MAAPAASTDPRHYVTEAVKASMDKTTDNSARVEAIVDTIFQGIAGDRTAQLEMVRYMPGRKIYQEAAVAAAGLITETATKTICTVEATGTAAAACVRYATGATVTCQFESASRAANMILGEKSDAGPVSKTTVTSDAKPAPVCSIVLLPVWNQMQHLFINRYEGCRFAIVVLPSKFALCDALCVLASSSSADVANMPTYWRFVGPSRINKGKPAGFVGVIDLGNKAERNASAKTFAAAVRAMDAKGGKGKESTAGDEDENEKRKSAPIVFYAAKKGKELRAQLESIGALKSTTDSDSKEKVWSAVFKNAKELAANKQTKFDAEDLWASTKDGEPKQFGVSDRKRRARKQTGDTSKQGTDGGVSVAADGSSIGNTKRDGASSAKTDRKSEGKGKRERKGRGKGKNKGKEQTTPDFMSAFAGYRPKPIVARLSN